MRYLLELRMHQIAGLKLVLRDYPESDWARTLARFVAPAYGYQNPVKSEPDALLPAQHPLPVTRHPSPGFI